MREYQDRSGWVYVVTSPPEHSMKGLMKIGHTTQGSDEDEARKKLRQRYMTYFSDPHFLIVLKVADVRQTEQDIFAELARFRQNAKHELFSGDFIKDILPVIARYQFRGETTDMTDAYDTHDVSSSSVASCSTSGTSCTSCSVCTESWAESSDGDESDATSAAPTTCARRTETRYHLRPRLQ